MHILQRLITPIVRLKNWTVGQLTNHLVLGESLLLKPAAQDHSLVMDLPLDKPEQDTHSGQDSSEPKNS